MAIKTTKQAKTAKERQKAGLRPPWKKGQSGNPGGRPKGTIDVKSFKEIIDRIGQESLLDSPLTPRAVKKKFYAAGPMTKKEGVMHVVYNAAMSGREWAAKYIADYSEGKPKEFHEITKKTVTIDIEQEAQSNIPIGEEIGTDDEEDIVTASDNSD